MQTLIVHSRRPIFFWRDLGPRRAVAAATLIVGAIFGCLFWPAFAIGTIWRALTVGQGAISPWRELSDVFTYILALAGVWTILLPALIAAKFRGLKVTTSVLVLLPVYSGDRGDVGGGVRSGLAAPLLGKDRPRKKSTGTKPTRHRNTRFNLTSLLPLTGRFQLS
jgi:hypothetical protein